MVKLTTCDRNSFQFHPNWSAVSLAESKMPLLASARIIMQRMAIYIVSACRLVTGERNLFWLVRQKIERVEHDCFRKGDCQNRLH